MDYNDVYINRQTDLRESFKFKMQAYYNWDDPRNSKILNPSEEAVAGR